jgi:hypothetical protein
VSGAHLGPETNFSLSLKFFFRQLRVCYFVAPSLTRILVCNLLVQMLLSLTRAIALGLKSRTTHRHSLLSHLRLPQPGGPVFISLRNRVAQLYPRVLGSLFVASYDSQGSGGGIPTRLLTGSCILFKTQLCRFVRTSQETHYVCATIPTS